MEGASFIEHVKMAPSNDEICSNPMFNYDFEDDDSFVPESLRAFLEDAIGKLDADLNDILEGGGNGNNNNICNQYIKHWMEDDGDSDMDEDPSPPPSMAEDIQELHTVLNSTNTSITPSSSMRIIEAPNDDNQYEQQQEEEEVVVQWQYSNRDPREEEEEPIMARLEHMVEEKQEDKDTCSIPEQEEAQECEEPITARLEQMDFEPMPSTTDCKRAKAAIQKKSYMELQPKPIPDPDAVDHETTTTSQFFQDILKQEEDLSLKPKPIPDPDALDLETTTSSQFFQDILKQEEDLSLKHNLIMELLDEDTEREEKFQENHRKQQELELDGVPPTALEPESDDDDDDEDGHHNLLAIRDLSAELLKAEQDFDTLVVPAASTSLSSLSCAKLINVNPGGTPKNRSPPKLEGMDAILGIVGGTNGDNDGDGSGYDRIEIEMADLGRDDDDHNDKNDEKERPYISPSSDEERGGGGGPIAKPQSPYDSIEIEMANLGRNDDDHNDEDDEKERSYISSRSDEERGGEAGPIAKPLPPPSIVHQADTPPTLQKVKQTRTKKETDELLSPAFSGLSFEERQKQQEVRHGVDGKISEEVNCALEELDGHLLSIKRGSKFELAESMDPHYVQNKAFRLMFLRGNECDPKAAADQMLRFFESKHQLFGAQKLVHDITIQDLDEDDIACLKAGWVQNAGRDRSGRQVFIKFAGLFRARKWSKTLLNDLRAQYFVVMNALMQSEETQVRGTVSIWYGVGDSKARSNNNGNPNELLQMFKAARALPQKQAATHICIDEMHQNFLWNVMIQLMKKNMRAQLRLHFGSLLECHYKLSTHGIVPGCLPVHTTNGSVNPTRHLQWVDSCIIAASSSNSMDSHPSSTLGCDGSPNAICHCSSSSSSLKNKYTTTPPPPTTTTHPNDVFFTGGKNNSHHHFGNELIQTLVIDCVPTPLYIESSSSSSSETTHKKPHLVDTIIGKNPFFGGCFQRPLQKEPW